MKQEKTLTTADKVTEILDVIKKQMHVHYKWGHLDTIDGKIGAELTFNGKVVYNQLTIKLQRKDKEFARLYMYNGLDFDPQIDGVEVLCRQMNKNSEWFDKNVIKHVDGDAKEVNANPFMSIMCYFAKQTPAAALNYLYKVVATNAKMRNVTKLSKLNIAPKAVSLAAENKKPNNGREM